MRSLPRHPFCNHFSLLINHHNKDLRKNEISLGPIFVPPLHDTDKEVEACGEEVASESLQSRK